MSHSAAIQSFTSPYQYGCIQQALQGSRRVQACSNGNLFRSRTLSCGEEGGARLEGDGAGPGSGAGAPLAGRSWLYSFLKPKE